MRSGVHFRRDLLLQAQASIVVKFVYVSDMSGNESDPVNRNEDVQRDRARDHHKDLIERLRRCKD